MGENGKVCTTFYGLLSIPKTLVYVYQNPPDFSFQTLPLNFFEFSQIQIGGYKNFYSNFFIRKNLPSLKICRNDFRYFQRQPKQKAKLRTLPTDFVGVIINFIKAVNNI